MCVAQLRVRYFCLTQSHNRDIKGPLRSTQTIRKVITVILVIRHAQKGPDGELTKEGRKAAFLAIPRALAEWSGTKGAIVAPNERARQTAIAAGLKIIEERPELAIPDEYEEYLNKIVVGKMLAQPGKPWEQSFTRAVMEDSLYKSVFAGWGETLANLVRIRASWQTSQTRFETATMGMFANDPDVFKVPNHLVFIGSSPLIELGYLVLKDSEDWQNLPRCRELEGFTFYGAQPHPFK